MLKCKKKKKKYSLSQLFFILTKNANALCDKAMPKKLTSLVNVNFYYCTKYYLQFQLDYDQVLRPRKSDVVGIRNQML